MLLPATEHRELAMGQPVIHSGWAVSRKILKGKPVYYILTPNNLLGYTQKKIKKGKNHPKISLRTDTLGSHNVVRSKDGYTLTFAGKETSTSSPFYVDMESEDPNSILAWYFALVSQWREGTGALRYNNLPPDIMVPESMKHYLYEPPFGNNQMGMASQQPGAYSQVPTYQIGSYPPQVPVQPGQMPMAGAANVPMAQTVPSSQSIPSNMQQGGMVYPHTQPQYNQQGYPSTSVPQRPGQTTQTVITTTTTSVPKNIQQGANKYSQGTGTGISQEYK